MQELDEKIEKTVSAEQQHEMQFGQEAEVTPDELTPETIVDAIEEGMDNAAVSVEHPDTFQVAGGRTDMIVDWFSKRTQEAQVRTGQAIPDEPVQTIGGRIVIKEASPDDVAAINEAMGGEYAKGINFPAIAEAMEQFDLATYYAQLKDANAELFEKARRGTVGFDAIMQGAEERGIDNIVVSMMKRRPGTPATAEEVLGGIIGSYHLIDETDKAFTAARGLPAGADRDAAMTRAMQLLSAQGVLIANVSGAASEAGRVMYAVGQAGKKLQTGDLAGRAARIESLFGAENVDDFEHIADLYMALPDPRAKAKFVEQGFLSKGMDMVTEVWINSILSSPVTHAVNIAGNASFMMLRTAETALAGGIGRLRTSVGIGQKQRARSREALAQLEGMRRGLLDATLLMGRVMITEAPGDAASKIDVRNTRAIGTTGDLREIATMVRDGNMTAAAVNAFGVSQRMAGRFLMAEDEFFKAIAYRMTVHQEAIVASGNAYDEAIAGGKSVAEAKKIAAELEASIIDNPPLDVVKTAKDAAKQMTFQEDLSGVMGNLQGAASHPIAKLFIPFFKTPTNVIKATLERTPLAVVSPEIRAQIRAGGREADIAVSKIAMGSSIMTGFAYAALGIDDPDNDTIIMGAGPKDFKAQQALSRQGIQPYSINRKIYTEDGKWTGRYHSVTYSRFDPMSGLLAMAADFAYYAQYEDDPAALDTLAIALSSSAANYVTQMPFLQGVQEMTKVFRDPTKLVENGTALFGQKLAEAGLSLVPTSSSFFANVERIGEAGEGAAGPVVGSTMLPETGEVSVGVGPVKLSFGEDIDPTTLPAYQQGFYTALQKFRARNPFFSDMVEPKLNLWGEKMTAGGGSGWEMVNPVRIQESKYSPVDEEILRLGGGIAMPGKRVDGVLLNATQYNKWITYMNTMDMSGDLPTIINDKGEEVDNPDYDGTETMLNALAYHISSSQRYASLPTKEEQLGDLTAIIGKYKSAALKMLRDEDIALDTKIRAVQ